MKLDHAFYARPTLTVAKELLGHVLVSRSPQGATAGVIVETEAYTQQDEACHANRGKTKRNATMFGPPGLGYVYLIYGMHYCFNVVSAQEHLGEAVLIRAIEPIAGIPLMARRRQIKDIRQLCSGPAKLCQALGISLIHDGIDLGQDEIFILQGTPPKEIITTTRIGISKAIDLPYRFYIKDNRFISRK